MNAVDPSGERGPATTRLRARDGYDDQWEPDVKRIFVKEGRLCHDICIYMVEKLEIVGARHGVTSKGESTGPEKRDMI